MVVQELVLLEAGHLWNSSERVLRAFKLPAELEQCRPHGRHSRTGGQHCVGSLCLFQGFGELSATYKQEGQKGAGQIEPWVDFQHLAMLALGLRESSCRGQATGVVMSKQQIQWVLLQRPLVLPDRFL